MTQQRVLLKILEKVFSRRSSFTHCKTTRLKNWCIQNTKQQSYWKNVFTICFHQDSFTIYVKFYLSQLKSCTTQSSSCSSLVSLFYSISLDHTLPQVLNIPNHMQSQVNLKLYTDHNTLLVRHATHQNAESLRAASLSKLDNMVNNNFIFHKKYAEFSTKWYVISRFHNPTYACNQH